MLVKDKKFILYKHTNKINGKVYIGITCQSPFKRWGLNGSLHTYNGMFHYKGYVVVNKGTSPDWRKWEDRKRKTTKVKQFDKEGNLIACFDSINEAARLTKTHKGSLSNCLNGKQPTAGGYIWKR